MVEHNNSGRWCQQDNQPNEEKSYYYCKRDDRLTGQCHSCTIQLVCKFTQFVQWIGSWIYAEYTLKLYCRVGGAMPGRGAVRPGRRDRGGHACRRGATLQADWSHYKRIDRTTSGWIALQAKSVLDHPYSIYYQAWPRFARRHMHSCLCYLYNFPLAMKYLPCHSINSSKVEEGGKSQLSDRLKPATVLNLIIRCQKRSLLIISLFFNDKVTLLYS